MPKRTPKDPTEFIVPLNMNGLEGRMLKLPAKRRNQREMLLLYGSHSSIERMLTIAQTLNRYGAVTLPDWPGFGGMDSLYKIKQEPTIDAMADYLASFVKMHYKKRRFTVVGMSYGFMIATRMLQRYPAIAKQVDIAVSIVGLAHYEDFLVPRRNFIVMKYGSKFMGGPLTSRFATLVVKKPVIHATYNLLASRHHKMQDATPEERRKRIAFEVILWHINDLRTYFTTAYTMFTANLCDIQVDLPVHHVAVNNDHFFNNELVEQHLAIIYREVIIYPVKLNAHMPTIVATAKEVAPFVPMKLRKLLAQPPA